MALNGDDTWMIGDHLHVTCPRSRHYRRYAVVTAVHGTRLAVVFDDGLPGQFVDRTRASHAPPLRNARRPRPRRNTNFEPAPPTNMAAREDRVRLVIDYNTPRHGQINVVIDSSMETLSDDEEVADISRTLERLAFTAAAIILARSDTAEQTNRLLDDFQTAVRDGTRRRSRDEARRRSRRDDAHH
jgi:hypothetical protein